MPEIDETPEVSYNLYEIGKLLGLPPDRMDLPTIKAKLQSMQGALRDASERLERWLRAVPRDFSKPISRPLHPLRDTDIAAMRYYRELASTIQLDEQD